MKKILTALLAFFVSASVFAIPLDITAGFAYGHSAVSKIEADSHNFNFKTGDADESIGFNAGFCSEIFKHFGLFFDLDCLWPMKTVSNSENSGVLIDTNGTFAMNGILGACFIIPTNDFVKFKLGAGFDVGGIGHKVTLDNAASTVKETAEYINIDYGVGIKTDVSFLLAKFVGLNIGCDFGFLWGNETITKDSGKILSYTAINSEKYDDKSFLLFIIPSVNAVIQLGHH